MKTYEQFLTEASAVKAERIKSQTEMLAKFEKMSGKYSEADYSTIYHIYTGAANKEIKDKADKLMKRGYLHENI